MKDTKTVPSHTTNGCGFPVTITMAPMRKIAGHWCLDIDPQVIMEKSALVLAAQPSKLAGVHVKFLRMWLGMSLREFAKKFDVSHAAVIKWEKAKYRPTSMGINAERILRMMVMAKLGISAEYTVQFAMAFRGDGKDNKGKLEIPSVEMKKSA